MWDEDRFKYNIATAMSNERLQLIIYPTELCNFRCVYCYEDHKGANMSPDVVLRIKKFLKQRVPSLKVLEIEWFGGEPLLTKDIVIDISSYAKELCEQHNIVFYAYLTTNGYLLDYETFCKLCKINILTYQITFDGDRENHNNFRIKAGKKHDTFDEIMTNVLATRKAVFDFSFVIRCHITSLNRESIKSLLTRLEDILANDKRYYIHLKEVSALGGPNDSELCLLKRDEVKSEIELIKKQYTKLQFINIEEEYICYAAKPNSFAIRSNGDIIKCTVAMNDIVNHVGHIESDGTLAIVQDKYVKWFIGLEEMDRDYLSCPYYRYFKKTSHNTNNK